MIISTVILLSRFSNGKKFSKKCLKQIAKENKGKVCKVANGTGIINNIRYYKENVIATLTFPLFDISCSGKINEEKKGKVSNLSIDKIELIQITQEELSNG